MNFIKKIKGDLGFIESIEDTSTALMKGTRISFVNGYAISIIRGEYSLGGKEGLFEIAPIDRDGDLNGKLLGIDGDDVEGWLTEEQVNKRIVKLANL